MPQPWRQLVASATPAPPYAYSAVQPPSTSSEVPVTSAEASEARHRCGPRQGRLWSALWPVLIGIALGIVLIRWERFVPRVPEGDVVVLEKRAARASLALGAALERAEGVFRQWPIAGLALLAAALLIGLALFSSMPGR